MWGALQGFEAAATLRESIFWPSDPIGNAHEQKRRLETGRNGAVDAQMFGCGIQKTQIGLPRLMALVKPGPKLAMLEKQIDTLDHWVGV